MAQLMEGDGHGIHRGLIGNTPGLPPRFPTVPNRGVSLSDFDSAFQGYYSNSGSLTKSYREYKSMPAYHVAVQDQQFLRPKLVDGSDLSLNSKSLHRRSASDSFTFLGENGSPCILSDIVEESDIPEESESKYHTSQSPDKSANDVKEDGDQLSDLLEEIQQLQDRHNVPISARSQAVHLNSDCSVGNDVGTVMGSVEAAARHTLPEHTVKTSDESEFYLFDSINGNPASLAEHLEGDLDPKRAKRVLANRQSAQRSRVRKLQYIAELERIVGTLQMEVSSLSRQVIYLKHQRALLNMDNNALKQQVVFFVQEKRNKDSQNEILKHDIRRLQKLSEFQSLHKSLQMQKQQQPQQHHIQRHCSLPTDFISTIHQSVEQKRASQVSRTEAASTDGITGLMRDFGGMSLDTTISQEKPSRTEI